MSLITNALLALDPEPAAQPDDAQLRRRDAMLERVVAAPRTSPSARRGPRQRWRVLAVSVGVAALAAPVALVAAPVLVHHLGPASRGLSDADLASWVSTTTPRSAIQLSAAAKRWCTAATDPQAGADAPVAVRGGDQRGSVASMIITRGRYTDVCLANEAGGGGAWEIVSGPDEPLAPVPAREVLQQSAGEHGSNGIGTAWGQAGKDVRSVVLHLGDRDVSAVVTDGVWSTWWPAARIGDDIPRTATAVFTDGSTAVVPVALP